ncbi:family S53 protease-like protein [Trametes maxima]|nr:family S53 protease-like protein [Trametes maxima]
MRFDIFLKQSNTTGIAEELLAVSDPDSPRYGHHLTQSEVNRRFAPPSESRDAVESWINTTGLTLQTYSEAVGAFTVQIPLAKANTLLNANYTPYIHVPTNTTLWRTLSYSIPAEIEAHTEFIYPTTQFIGPPTRKIVTSVMKRGSATYMSKRTALSSNCTDSISPQCLRALYNIPLGTSTVANNSLAVSGFGGEVANITDLETFLQAQTGAGASNVTLHVQSVDDGANEGQGTPEASLDTQYTIGLATDVNTTFVTVGPNNEDGVQGFLDVINLLMDQGPLPLVLTTSFEFDESAFGSAQDLALTLCHAYGLMGTRGTSVLFASGDGGVSGVQSDNSCEGKPFVPTFPASCPYVTAVGSTQGSNPEVAAPFSAGGFSNLFPVPQYQEASVSAYLSKFQNNYTDLYNQSGRAYPDVSTQGVNFQIRVAGAWQSVSGTSASSPTFAAMVALVNDRLLASERKPLGFLNPLLYRPNATSVFNDITEGNNPGCGTDGFTALEGWDPVTGLGTPDFTKLLNFVEASLPVVQSAASA